MCDKCGNIFSENEEDWSTFSGSFMRRREDGSRRQETLSQDACPDCTAGRTVVKPRVSTIAAIAAAPSFPVAHDVPPNKPDYARIAELEAENGITPTATGPVSAGYPHEGNGF
jgi:acetone carboxylase gamma subunit